jgi:murE/murF fusion protein
VKRLAAGATLIDDSYNANPDSVRAAIDVLAAQPAPAVLVLGTMGEVGAHGAEYHAEVGRYARERGLAGLITLGEATREAVTAFGAGARQCASVEEAVAAARERAVAGATLLVKGSRFMRMERVSAALAGESAEVH